MYSFFSSENIDWLWRVLLVQIIILFLFFVSFSNIPLNLEEFRLQFFLIALFYWTIFRPTLLPPIYVFFLGFLQDLIMHYPIGFHAIVFLVLQMTLKRQRTFLMGQSHFVLWILFSLSCFVFFAIEWLFFSARFLSFAEFSFLSPLLTVIIYPIVTSIFVPFHRLLPYVQGINK